MRVWDLPTRLVHWLMVLGVALSWWTGETGRLEWHRWSGYGLLGLVAFRIYWGFFGSSTARFRQFLRGPRTVVGYLRGAWPPAPGHNPLGALSVLALLALLAAQIVLGLFAVDVDGIESGPLSLYVSFDAGRSAAKWHGAIFNALLWLIALHIVAIAVLRVREEAEPRRGHAAWRARVSAAAAGGAARFRAAIPRRSGPRHAALVAGRARIPVDLDQFLRAP